MKLSAAVVVALLSSQLCFAQSVRTDADPGLAGEGFVAYTGHFGEVFKLRGGWQIDPFMSGGTEVINLYPKYRPDVPDSIDAFKPKAEDFKPENFSRLQLIQLTIIPRSADAFRSIEELKKAKAADLSASGVGYKIVERPSFPAARGAWPEGTFEVTIESPYRLTQLYTATPSYLCILTSGVDTPPSTAILRHSGFLYYALAAWLVPQADPAAASPGGVSLELFAAPNVRRGWVLFVGLGLLLAAALRLGLRRKDLGDAILGVLVLAHAGASAAGGFAWLSWRWEWSSHHAPFPAGVACLLLPPLAAWLSRGSSPAARRGALAASAAWAVACAAFLIYFSSFDSSFARTLIGRYDWGGGDSARLLFAYNAIIGFVAFALGGLLAALMRLTASLPGKRDLAVILALLALAAARSSNAQDANDRARAALAQKGVTEDSLRDKALENLSKTRVIYDYQRVEIKGIFSRNTPDNDTDGTFGPLFDLQIAPTHMKDPKAGIIPDWIRNAPGAVKDLRDLHKDTYQEFTDAAVAAVEQLSGKEVNEIVAHSWGSEIVYNAILAGKIAPPRRLIVAGMPDRDREKWRLLAKFTGTEVIAYTDSSDPIAGAARATGGAIEAGEKMSVNLAEVQSPGLVVTVPTPAAVFEQAWTESCAKRAPRNPCNPHQRTVTEPEYRDAYKGGTHDRLEYYQAMEDAGDLPKQPLEQKLFKETEPPFPGSAKAVRLAQDQMIAKETRRLYEGAVARERRALEAESISGDASFLAGAGQIQTMTAEAKAALEKQVHAEERAIEQTRLATIRAEKAARQEESRRVWAEIEREDRARKYVQSLAGEACSNPARMDELANEHGIVPVTDLLPASVDSSYSTMDTSGPGSLSRCQMAVLDLFDSARRRGYSVSSANLAQWARQYHDAHPGPIAKLGKALSGFFSAFGDLLDVPVESSGSSSSTRERPERAERVEREEKHCEYTYIPELNQTIRSCAVY